MLLQISKPSGLVQWQDKVRYYSPNSEVTAYLIVDSSDERTLESNPFQPGKGGKDRVCYRDFVKPRKWSKAFAWIAFIPVVPSQWFCNYHSYVGQILSQYPLIDRYTDSNGQISGHRIRPGSTWVQLESDLYQAVVALSGHYHIPCVLPFLPTTLRYSEMFSQKRHLKRILEQTREWFLVWLGALSYLVACLKHPWTENCQWKSQMDHQWASVLRSRGISPSFVDGIQNSLVVATYGVRRAGVVVDVSKMVDGQPPPEWYVKQGVAVWYRWDEEEEKLMEVGRLRPDLRPPLLLQGDLESSTGSGLISSELQNDHLSMDRTQSYPHMRAPTRQTNPSSPTEDHAPFLMTRPPVPSVPSRGTRHTEPSTADLVQSGATSLQGAIVHGCRNPERSPRQTTGLAKPPSPPALSCADRQSGDGAVEPEWEAFFRGREEHHARALLTESAADRMRRENRIREPATATAKVFEWYRSARPGVLYERLPVLAKARIDTLQAYGETQKRYDPFFNEWDCCDEWGHDDNSDEEDPNMYSAADPGDAVSATMIPPAISSSLVRIHRYPLPASTSLSYAQADRPTDVFEVSMPASHGSSTMAYLIDVLRISFGFYYPVPGVTFPSLRESDTKKATFVFRVVGSTRDDESKDGHDSTLLHAAYDFLQALCSRQEPIPGSWDLRDECVSPIRLCGRIKTLRLIHLDDQHKVDEYDRVWRYHVFDSDSADGERWRFGVTSASDALLACRLPKEYTMYDCVTFFVRHGIPFRTFYPSPMLPRPSTLSAAQASAYQVPQRPFEHRFTKDDYDAYIHTRTLVLSQPHMQAALKRGGIIWRLAVGTLGISRASLAPSLVASTHPVSIGGGQFIDDALTTTELDLICGAYECVSDDGKKRSLKSWWPLARYYEKEECGENYGRWTPRRESWYAKRLDSIESDKTHRQQPLTYTEWKSTQHGPGIIRNFHSHVEQSSHQVLISQQGATSAL